MSEKPARPGLALEPDDPRERELWEALGEIEQPEPPAALRREFYRRLETLPGPRADRWRAGLRRWLFHPLLPATAMLLVGIVIGRALTPPAPAEDLLALRQEVAMLHRDVALSLLHNRSAAERLKGALTAADFSADAEITRALLSQAASDPSQAVRAAAIDALGPRVRTADVSAEVLRLLGEGVSPLVEKALVDLILRHGDAAQLETLLAMAQRRDLYPDLAAYVNRTVKRTGA